MPGRMLSRAPLPAVRNCSNEGQYGPGVRLGVQSEIAGELVDDDPCPVESAVDATSEPLPGDNHKAVATGKATKIVGYL